MLFEQANTKPEGKDAVNSQEVFRHINNKKKYRERVLLSLQRVKSYRRKASRRTYELSSTARSSTNFLRAFSLFLIFSPFLLVVFFYNIYRFVKKMINKFLKEILNYMSNFSEFYFNDIHWKRHVSSAYLQVMHSCSLNDGSLARFRRTPWIPLELWFITADSFKENREQRANTKNRKNDDSNFSVLWQNNLLVLRMRRWFIYWFW